MRSMRLTPALWLALAVLAAGTSVLAADFQAFYQDLSQALLEMGLTPQDTRIRHDYAAPDAFRLPLVDSLMYEPTTLLSRVDALATGLEDDSTLAEMTRHLCEALAITPCLELPACARDTGYHGMRIKNVKGNLAHLPPGLKKALTGYSGQLARLALLRDAAIAGAKPDLHFLYENSPFLVTPRQEYEDVDPFELERLEEAETALGDSVLALAQKIDRTYLAAMSLSAVRAAEDLLPFVEHFGGRPGCDCCARKSMRYNGGRATFAGQTSRVTGKIAYLGLTAQGPVVVGGWGENTYEGAFALILDMGGDDTYNLTYDPAVSFGLIVDRQGNDTYESEDRAAVAGAVFGTSIILDLAGDDCYRSGDLSLGAGIFGAGLLYDGAGVDTYTSGAFSQGAGFVGMGILCDAAGNDCYTAGMQSQAFGYVGGTGIILDRAGNDTYLTSMSQADILRYDDHYLTLSQGCAFGYRPDYSGGIGLLIESEGNDLYSSDIFGQGVGYWFCVGAIVDRAGHDCYRSYQYAQGAGIHLAFGLLSDESGDDYYVSKGVSQGCGHDLSLGLLADFSGNDCYTAVDLSQGAGNANGTGILYDADGVDSYSAKNKVNVNGYGDYRREFGSIGLQIDSRGTDFYSARGENQALWESGKYGLGVDMPGESTKPRGDIVVKEYPFQERAFTTEELYVLAMRSEPRFQAWRKYGFDSLVADSIASMEYLRTVLDTKNATKRHAIKDILVAIGPPAVPMLCAEVRGGNDLARAEAAWILGLIGNAEAFDALMELSRSEDWKLRSNALNSLARLENLGPEEEKRLADRVASVLEDTGEVFYVGKDAAFVAGNRAYCDLAPLLARRLDDAHYSVRFAAAEALRQLSAGEPRRDPSHPPCDRVAAALKDRIADAGPTGLVPAVYAAGQLPAVAKLDVAEAALGTPHGGEIEVAVAVARLLRSVTPATPAETKRLDRLMARLPRDAWEVKSVLAP